MRILVAEDSEVIRELLAFHLAEFNPEFARDGAEAVAAFRRRPFDFVLLDLDMPVMAGDEAAVLIREADAEVPLAFFTGHGDEARASAKVRASRPAAVLVKPDDFGRLHAVIREAVEARKAVAA